MQRIIPVSSVAASVALQKICNLPLQILIVYVHQNRKRSWLLLVWLTDTTKHSVHCSSENVTLVRSTRRLTPLIHALLKAEDPFLPGSFQHFHLFYFSTSTKCFCQSCSLTIPLSIPLSISHFLSPFTYLHPCVRFFPVKTSPLEKMSPVEQKKVMSI